MTTHSYMSDWMPKVAEAIEEIKRAYPDAKVDPSPDNEGGAYVSVSEDMGVMYRSEDGGHTLQFQIPYNHPEAQVKDFYVIPPLVKLDGSCLPNGFHHANFRMQDATQVSRIKRDYDPDRDKSLALKIAKILKCIRQG